ncbi:MAG: autotransporter-associated beta strand repeat-containing protein [Patescibacteria group bacterium]|nr:autotransporter-associated beta strand repeat-containing protein [Patescibacteria group bacterium]
MASLRTCAITLTMALAQLFVGGPLGGEAAVVQVGAGSDLAATNLDGTGSRLNIDNTIYPTLVATTYDVLNFEYKASTNVGNVQPFLAVLTGANTYQVIWVGPTAASPSAGGIATISYGLGTQQFTLAADSAVYAGFNAASNTIYYGAGVTDHHNPAIFTINAGASIGPFGSNDLARSYAFEINVIAGASAANTLTWDSAGNGNWTDSRWTGDAMPDYPDATVYAVVQTNTVTVTGNQAAQRLTMASGGVSIEPGASLTLGNLTAIVVEGSGSLALNGGASGASLVATNGGGSISSLVLNGQGTISNATQLTVRTFSDGGAAGKLTKQGVGDLVLTAAGASTITGGTSFEVQAGRLVAVRNGSNNPLGTAPVTLNGGGLTLSSTAGGTFDNAITVAQSGTILAQLTAPGVATQTVTLGSSSRGVSISAGQTLTLGTADGYTLAVAGTVSGDGALAVTGNTGVVRLNVANSYQGQTTVLNGGRLAVLNSGALGATTAGTVVESGGQLRLQNNVAIAAGEAITIAGDGPSTEGALRNDSGNNSVANLTLAAAARIFSNADTLTISSTLNANYALTFDGGSTTDVSGQVTGGSAITKTGTGLLRLSNAGNSFTGQLNITAGRVQVTANGQLGGTAGGTVVSSVGTLELASGVHYTTLEPISIAGPGALALGSINSAGGNTRLDSNITITGSTAINSAVVGNTLTLAGPMLMSSSSTLSFTGAGNIDVLQGFGPSSTFNNSVVKQGTGTVTLFGANTYNGTTAVHGGTLVAAHSDSLGTADAGVSINNGILALQGDVSIRSGKSLALGGLGGAGTLQNRAGVNRWGGNVSLDKMGAKFESQAGTLTIGGAVAMGESSLTVSGAGNTVIEGAISGTNLDTYRYAAGLLAGYIEANGTQFGANPGNHGIVLSPEAGLTNVSPPWGDYRTWVYTGQFYDADGIFSFAENIDDVAWMMVDGIVRMNNSSWSVPTSTGILNLGMGVNGDGWHDVEIRFYNGSGGKGAVAGNGWTITKGFGLNINGAVSINGTISTNGNDYPDSVTDPGDGTLWRYGIAMSPNDLIKTGTGTLTLSGANTYVGTTTVQQGTLLVNGSHVGGGAYTVQNGGTLGGSGVIGSAVAVQGGGMLSPGVSPGVLAMQSLSLEAGSTTLMEIDGLARGTEHDGVDITAEDGLAYGGSLLLDFGNTTWLEAGAVLDLFNFTGTATGAFSDVTSTGFYAGEWAPDGGGVFSLESGWQTLLFSHATGDLTIVPEPAAWLLLLCAAACSLWVRRRK